MLPVSAGIIRHSLAAGIHRSIAAGIQGDRVDPVTRQLLSVPGLSYYLDCGRSELYARHGLGDVRVGFMAARNSSAPGVHIAPDGRIITETRSDVPLTVAGYWDTTGFHAFNRPGWWVGTAATNLLPNSVFADSENTWSLYVNSESGAVANKSVYAGGMSGPCHQVQVISTGMTLPDIQYYQSGISIVAGERYTISTLVWADAVQQIGIKVMESEPPYASYLEMYADTVANGWSAVTVSFVASETNSNARIGFDIGNFGSGWVFRADAIQIEKSPYSTLFVPTTTAALTRPKDVVTMATAGNRNAAEETMIIVATPWGNFANDGLGRYLSSTDGKNRVLQKFSSYSELQYKPNASDSAYTCARAYGAVISGNTYTFAAVCKHSPPYAQLYVDGVSVAEDSFIDYVNPAWGDITYLGSDPAGADQFNGVIHAVVVFNRALSAAEVAFVTNLLNGAA